MDVTYPFHFLSQIRGGRRLELWWQKGQEFRLRKLFRKSEKQCVHYLYPENSLFKGAHWKGRHGLVLSCHQPISSLPNSPEFRAALNMADRVVVLSSHFEEGYRNLCDARKIVTIHHGVDIHFFRPDVGSEEKSQRVLTIGNWLRDYELWARVVTRVLPEFPDMRFTVVALPNNLDRIRKQLDEATLQRVDLLAGLSDTELKNLYARTSLLFLPLKDAGANNALLESMACGIPSVVSDLPATREYAGDCGTYFENSNVDQCCSALRALLLDNQKRQELGEKCRERAVKHFAWELIADQYAKLYADVLNQA